MEYQDLGVVALRRTCDFEDTSNIKMSQFLSEAVPIQVVNQLSDLIRSRCDIDHSSMPEGRMNTIYSQRCYIEWIGDYDQE